MSYDDVDLNGLKMDFDGIFLHDVVTGDVISYNGHRLGVVRGSRWIELISTLRMPSDITTGGDYSMFTDGYVLTRLCANIRDVLIDSDGRPRLAAMPAQPIGDECGGNFVNFTDNLNLFFRLKSVDLRHEEDQQTLFVHFEWNHIRGRYPEMGFLAFDFRTLELLQCVSFKYHIEVFIPLGRRRMLCIDTARVTLAVLDEQQVGCVYKRVSQPQYVNIELEYELFKGGKFPNRADHSSQVVALVLKTPIKNERHLQLVRINSVTRQVQCSGFLKGNNQLAFFNNPLRNLCVCVNFDRQVIKVGDYMTEQVLFSIDVGARYNIFPYSTQPSILGFEPNGNVWWTSEVNSKVCFFRPASQGGSRIDSVPIKERNTVEFVLNEYAYTSHRETDVISVLQTKEWSDKTHYKVADPRLKREVFGTMLAFDRLESKPEETSLPKLPMPLKLNIFQHLAAFASNDLTTENVTSKPDK